MSEHVARDDCIKPTTRRQAILCLAACTLLAGFSESPRQRPRWPLDLTVDLNASRGAINASLDTAYERLAKFASANDFTAALQEIKIERVSIFGTKDAYDTTFRRLANLPADREIPKRRIAMFKQGVIYACTEAAARKADPRIRSRNDYVKVLTHEMAHALHVALAGENLGPLWFREGFACIAADQFTDALAPAVAVAQGAMSDTADDYRLIAATTRILARKHPLRALVARAGQPDFTAWAQAALVD